MHIFTRQKYIYYIFNFVNRFMVYLPVFVLFLKSKGLDQTHIMIMMSAYNIAIMAGELPTGIFADKISRKVSVMLGCIIQGMAMLCMIPISSFYGLVLIEVLFGIGLTLQSGAMSAMFYDYLGSVGKEAKYPEIEGKRWASVFVSQALASILGGFLAEYDIVLTIGITGMVYLISAIVLFWFQEIPVKPQKEIHYLKHAAITFKYISYTKNIFTLLAVIVLTEVLFSTTMWLYQPYYENIGIKVTAFGAAYFLMNSISALGGFLSGKMNFSYKKVVLLYTGGTAVFIGMMGLIHSAVGILIPSCIFFVKGLLNPWIQSFWEKNIEDKMRATASSLLSLLSSLMFAAVAIPIGFVSDRFSVFAALGVSVIIYGVILCVFYLCIKFWKVNEMVS